MPLCPPRRRRLIGRLVSAIGDLQSPLQRTPEPGNPFPPNNFAQPDKVAIRLFFFSLSHLLFVAACLGTISQQLLVDRLSTPLHFSSPPRLSASFWRFPISKPAAVFTARSPEVHQKKESKMGESRYGTFAAGAPPPGAGRSV